MNVRAGEPMAGVSLESKAKKFWESDLDEIEESFLKGRKITELPVSMDNRVPSEGSIMLDRIVDIDKVVPEHNRFTAFFLWLYYLFKLRIAKRLRSIFRRGG